MEIDTTTKYIPLCRAIQTGDWEKAQDIFNKDKDALTAKLNLSEERIIHFALNTSQNNQLIENLLNEITPESLPTLVDKIHFNALHSAAVVGNTTASRIVVEKNPYLLFMVDGKKYLPIHRALMNSYKTTFKYLFAVSKQYIHLSEQPGYHSPFEGICGVRLITNVIEAGLLDLASELIKDFPNLARVSEGARNALTSIASKRDSYFSGTRYNFYQRFVYYYLPILGNKDLDDADKKKDTQNQGTYNTNFATICFQYPVIQSIYVKIWKFALLQVPHIKYLREEKVKHKKALKLLKCICEELGELTSYSDLFGQYGQPFVLAVINDTPEAIEEMVGCFPSAIWTTHDGLFTSQTAIINRCENVFNFLVHRVEKHLHSALLDKNGNNLLHLTGQLAPIHKLNVVSGAAMQMQRELQWYKEVEKFVLPSYIEQKNNENETPIMVFRREHKKLREDGEEWMKKTADSYTITAALIITIAFAAAITVPGGNNDTGDAIFATKASFIVFAVSDAISLFTSTTSLLLFLSILTARYREEDFLYRLPKRLIFGLTMLFLSVTSMMIAFSATLYLLFAQEKTWILIPIATLTCLPIASFVTLQFPLLVDLISSTYGHGIFVRRKDHTE